MKFFRRKYPVGSSAKAEGKGLVTSFIRTHEERKDAKNPDFSRLSVVELKYPSEGNSIVRVGATH